MRHWRECVVVGVGQRETDCPPKGGVVRVGHLVPVRIVVDEFCVVGEGISVGDVEQQSREVEVTTQ